MAVGRQFNWEGQQRVDVPHLRLVESGVIYDFDTLAGVTLTGRNPYVIQGFAMAASTPGQAASTLQLVTAGSTIFHYGASENGTMLQVPSTRAAETLAVTNPRVRGGFTASQTNYIGIDFLRSADSTTSDIVQFLDATTITEAPKTIPLARTLDYVIVISTTPFSANTALCPIAKVVTDASNNVVSVSDARTLYFRLGLGGDSPTPLGTYSWPQGQGVGVAPATESASFTGGDKAITNEKDWKSALMTMIWQTNAGEYWYSPTTMNNTMFIGGGLNNFTWAAPNLSWAAAIKIIFSGSTAITNTINAGNVNLNDGECMYVDFNRYTDGTILTPVVASIQTLGGSPATPGIRYVIAWRIGANAYLRNYPVPVGTTLVGVATTLLTGTVKINTADANPYAVISTGLGGAAIASGLTRQGMGAGTLALGGGADDDFMTFQTTLAAGAAGTNYIFDTGGITRTGTHTIFDIQNNTSSILAVTASQILFKGNFGVTFINGDGFIGSDRNLGAPGTQMMIEGARDAADTLNGPDIVLKSYHTRTASNVLEIWNGLSTLFGVDYAGVIRGVQTAGSAGIDIAIGGSIGVTRTNGYLLAVENNTTTEMSVRYDGAIFSANTETNSATMGTNWAAGANLIWRSAGFVHVQLAATATVPAATWATIATLPVGFRPTVDIMFFGASVHGGVRWMTEFKITSTGVVSAVNYDADTGLGAGLSAIYGLVNGDTMELHASFAAA